MTPAPIADELGAIAVTVRDAVRRALETVDPASVAASRLKLALLVTERLSPLSVDVANLEYGADATTERDLRVMSALVEMAPTPAEGLAVAQMVRKDG